MEGLASTDGTMDAIHMTQVDCTYITSQQLGGRDTVANLAQVAAKTELRDLVKRIGVNAQVCSSI